MNRCVFLLREDKYICRNCGLVAPAQNSIAHCRPERMSPQSTCAAGSELKLLLKVFGIVAKEGCSCTSRAAKMDAMGCDWCEQNIDEIVGWLREEATKRKLPFVDLAGRMLVRRAIANARRKSLS
jgi:hypothetical protein